MKNLLKVILFVFAVSLVASSCAESDWDKYEDWRAENNAYVVHQESMLDENGSLFYTKVVPTWNTGAYVLMHYFNDRSLTVNNESPLETSYVDVKYRGILCDGTAFDSSYLSVTPADSVLRFQCNNVVAGFSIALQNMRVGDSCRVVIPYEWGYGAYTTTSVIKPYSTLVFDMKLVDIPGYVVRPTSD